MGLPIACVDAGIGDGIFAVDHHTIADINAHMGCAVGVIGTLEEDNISRFCGAGRDDGELSAQCLCIQPAIVSAVSAVVNDPAHKAGAVKGCGWTAAAPE